MDNEQAALGISAVEATKSLLSDLKQLSRHVGEPVAAVFADSLLRKMRSLRDLYMGDPYTEIVMALHDALAYQNNWIEYGSEQYQDVYNLFLSLVEQEKITNVEVENAIIALEQIGFDTLPFEVKFEGEINGATRRG